MSKKQLTVVLTVNADTCVPSLQKWLETCPHAHSVEVVSSAVSDDSTGDTEGNSVGDNGAPVDPAGIEGQSDDPASDGAPAPDAGETQQTDTEQAAA
jgi:hypothetical protein